MGNVSDVPELYVDYILCEKFGWTIEELENQDQDKINTFIRFIEMESRRAEFENKKANL